ncbi:MAG: hypothetical protein ACM37W_20395 [Actinomycetota bacterium]
MELDIFIIAPFIKVRSDGYRDNDVIVERKMCDRNASFLVSCSKPFL